MTNQEELNFENTRFFGEGYYEPRDKGALVSQLTKVFNCLRDGNWWTLGDIENRIDAPQASISAAIRSLRNEHHLIIDKKLRDGSRGTWLYCLKGKMTEDEIQQQRIRNIKPIGDKEKFGEFMRSVYAVAHDNSDENMAQLREANKLWVFDLINRIKQNKV